MAWSEARKRRLPRARLLVVGPWWACACAAPTGSQPAACPTRAALVGGAPTADVVAISTAAKRAIGRVRPRHGRAFCTGTLIAPSWVLTAGHCDRSGALSVELPSASDAPSVVFEVRAAHRAPDLDVMLLELAAHSAAQPLPILQDAETYAHLLGTAVDLAGYGVDADGRPAAALGLLAERVVRVDDGSIDVDGLGRTGACLGDSGGPMLVRDARGALGVAGILSSGSATCTRVDHYVRADAIASFARAVGVSSPRAVAGCDGLSSTGLCRDHTAVFCAQGRVRATACSDERPCGFSPGQGGYRCIEPAEDVCHGIDDLGRCDEGTASRCLDGKVQHVDCEACGGRCGWDASAGHVACLGP